jgi:hypothetical protein
MLTIILSALAGGAIFFAGAKGVPFTVAWFKSWSASRAVTAAKAVIAKAEADAKALEDAKKVVAAATLAPVVFPTKAPAPQPLAPLAPIGATGPA